VALAPRILRFVATPLPAPLRCRTMAPEQSNGWRRPPHGRLNPKPGNAASKLAETLDTLEGHMKRYARYPRFRFRPAFAAAAVALSAATMLLAVGVPVALSPGHAAATAEAPATSRSIEVAIVPASIEVVGLRAEAVAARPERAAVRHTSFRS